MNYKLGDRVRISPNYNWAQGVSGTIDNAPEFARDLVAEEAPWEGHRRFVQGAKGPVEIYWVWFDEPQYDPDGDGPYKGSEIESDAIEPLESGLHDQSYVPNRKDEPN